MHVLYWTAYIGADDPLHFAPDVYSRDGDLERAMLTQITNRQASRHGGE